MTMPTAAERKAQTIATFDRLASTYDTMGFTRRAAERLVAVADLQPGERVLDVATGTGWAAVAAGAAVGPSGHVIGTDLAQSQLDLALQKAAAINLGNVEFGVGDAESPDLSDAAVDVTLCASSIFFLPRPEQALLAWRRVTKPGGRVLFSSFGPGLFGRLRDVFEERLGLLSSMPPRTPMSPDTAAECVALLREAGFSDVSVVEERLDYFVPNAEGWWAELWAGLLRQPLMPLTADQLSAFRGDYLAHVERMATPDGVLVEVPAIFATGVVPIG